MKTVICRSVADPASVGQSRWTAVRGRDLRGHPAKHDDRYTLTTTPYPARDTGPHRHCRHPPAAANVDEYGCLIIKAPSL